MVWKCHSRDAGFPRGGLAQCELFFGGDHNKLRLGVQRFERVRVIHRSWCAGAVLVLVSAGLAGCAAAPEPPHDNFSAVDLQAREAYLADLAASSGLVDPPGFPLVRFVASEEWASVQIDCLQQAGFPVKLLSDGVGIDVSDVPEGQRAKGGTFFLAQYECESKYTIDPATQQPLSDDALGELYDWYVSESVPCLEAQGIIGPEPPSRQVFIETSFTNEWWYPYIAVDAMAMPEAEWNALNAACPQSPADSARAH